MRHHQLLPHQHRGDSGTAVVPLVLRIHLQVLLVRFLLSQREAGCGQLTSRLAKPPEGHSGVRSSGQCHAFLHKVFAEPNELEAGSTLASGGALPANQAQAWPWLAARRT